MGEVVSVRRAVEVPGVGELFPFFVRVDREMRVVEVGRSVARVCPGVELGVGWAELFVPVRPVVTPTFEALAALVDTVVWFDALVTGVRLRGSIARCDGGDGLAFLVSPWFTELGAFERAGLAPSDLATTDVQADLLTIMQSRQGALDEARRAVAALEAQRDELREANEALTRAVAAKGQFLATTSHELRTPLAGILGMGSLLQRTDLSPLQRGYTDKLVRAAQGLLAVVNDVLDLAKLDAGKLTIEPAPFDLWPLVQDLSEMFAVNAQQKGVDLTCWLDPSVPRRVDGDAGRLRQVLSNLLNNAVKFTERGEVRLRVTCDGGPLVRFEVTDTGVGVEPSETLFRRFEQGDAETARRFGGTGLGLAIARELAELMGGAIGAEGKKGEGSTFWFTASLPASAGTEEVHDSFWEGLSGRRALVVDNGTTSRSHVVDFLGRWGVRSDEAESALDALTMLREAASRGAGYDLLLADASLPIMSGIDLAVLVAGDGALARLKVILLVDIAQGARQDPRLKEGRVHGFVSKPVHASTLYNCVLESLSSDSSPGSPGARSARSGSRGPASPSLPPDAPRLLVVDDNGINRELAVAMLRELGYAADVACSGLEALVALEKRAYPLVLMDLQMPEMDGYTAVSELRRREARFDDGRHTTVVAVTAHAMEEDRKLALASGMDDYISKPFELADLATLLGAWVGELPRPFSSKPSAAQHAAAAPSHAAPLQVRDAIRSVELFDPSALDKLRQLDGGGDLVSQVVEVFLGELPTRRDAVRVALAQGDVGAAGRAAHALRSGALAVGATGLADACARLELLARSGDLATARALGIELEEFCKNAASLVRRGASRAPGR